MSKRTITYLASGRLGRQPDRRVMLLVEDPVLRVAVGRLLRDHGFAVREVPSLQDAIWRADLEAPDAVVMDVPRDWAEARMAARSFRVLRVTHETPLLALAPRLPAAAEAQGFDGVLSVPITGRTLLRRLEGLLARRGRWGGAA